MSVEAFTMQAEQVSKAFGRGRRHMLAVDRVTLGVGSARSLGIVGESGSGKSTLARMLVGLSMPSGGSITVQGVPIQTALGDRRSTRAFRRDVQFIAQDTTSSFDPRRTLRDAIAGPLTQLTSLSRAEAAQRLAETLDLVRISADLADRYPHEVSGGQRQRMSIARALVVRPRLLVCDEIVSALDVSIQGSILTMLKSYVATHNAGLVFVSHGLPATGFITDEVLVMHRGRVVEAGRTAEVFRSPQQPYTQALVAAHRRRHTARL